MHPGEGDGMNDLRLEAFKNFSLQKDLSCPTAEQDPDGDKQISMRNKEHLRDVIIHPGARYFLHQFNSLNQYLLSY